MSIQESVRFLRLIGFNLLFVSINSLSFYFGTKEVWTRILAKHLVSPETFRF